MGFKTISIKKSYSSDSDNILEDFYIPSLKQSIEYQRLAGFFSSKSISVAARGILGLIKNGGDMKLVISPKLSKDDIDVILSSQIQTNKILEDNFLKELDKIENDFERDHVAALGWMIANNRLHIKVAIPLNTIGIPYAYIDIDQNGLFHQKVGILKDNNGDIISFSGSINETASGWLNNIEEFKVFRNWDESENDYVIADTTKFTRFWNNMAERVEIIELPIAVKNKLIEIAPDNIDQIDLNKHYAKKKYTSPQLYQHQKEAISRWVDNNHRGIFEMATGTGKTYAALGCVKKVEELHESLITCISCPYQHLVQQWKKEVDKFGINYDKLLVADSSSHGWKNKLANNLMDISLGYKHKIIIITTHDTFASESFIKIIKQFKSNSKLFIIADEVHGLGAHIRRTGLIEEYDFRLGLSATPKRWFDPIGTKILYDYFGDTIYEFGLEKAINTINPDTGKTYLVPYRYNINFAYLEDDELEEYITKTAKIVKLWGKEEGKNEQNDYLEQLLFARANIIKNARSKFEELGGILDSLPTPIKWTLIYCSPQQIDSVMEILRVRGYFAHRFTMEEGTTASQKYKGLSEREYLLEEFSKGKYQILVAMRCLDEGVDVPPARTAILMASSGNPREYIQRIGRVLRRASDKSEATINDIVVIPNLGGFSEEIRAVEKKIFEKELIRYEEISKYAMNNVEALRIISILRNSKGF
ncbi:MAG: hypothetical protein A2029_02730 [Chloroflexi bacterium RBG_19FT_COMBO_47_9]|nr:MAG: hypothetical protein A2029_02730 [Chloroflexi bacterium RBG_19FT_COMBO_47_9]